MKLSERSIVSVVTKAGPWLAPVPTAWLVFESTRSELGWPTWVGAACAVLVESLGLGATFTAFEFASHNAGLREDDEQNHAPFRLAALMSGVYLATVIVLTVLLDVVPRLTAWAPVMFPLFGLCAYVILGARANHERRVEVMILSSTPPYNRKRHRLIKAELEREMALSDNVKPVSKKTGEMSGTSETASDNVTLPDWIVGQPPDGKWTKADFERLVPDTVELSPDRRRKLSDIADVTSRTVRRWESRRNGK